MEKVENMRRKMQQDWLKENMETVSTKMPKPYARAFKRLCDRRGVKRYGMLQELILRELRADATRYPPALL